MSRFRPAADKTARSAVFRCAGALLLALALGKYLDRFHLMYSETGVVTGPGWTDIRLWDRRALDAVYKQFQEIRLYYEFFDVDVDRYTAGGKYIQAMKPFRTT